MKIGYDAKRAFFNFRGLGNYSRTLLLSLSEFYSDDKYSLYTPTYETQQALNFESIIQSENVKICTPQKKIAIWFPSWWRSFFLSGRIKEDAPDIFHGLSHELPHGIDKLNIKKIVTVHDLIFMRYPEFFPLVDRAIYKKKLLYCTRVADRIVAICEQTKQDLMNLLNVDEAKIDVVYQSCDPRFYDLSTNEELAVFEKKYQLKKNGFILNVGALEERKNALTLVKAFDVIKDKTDLDLVLVGKGKKYKEEIKNFIQLKNLNKRVRIISNIGHEDLPSIYQLAKMTVYPSLFEGFGIPIIESLFCGTPVITSKGSCFPEAGGPGAIYIDPLKISEMADQILHLERDNKLYFQLKNDGRNYVEKFHFKNTSKVMHDLYLKLLA